MEDKSNIHIYNNPVVKNPENSPGEIAKDNIFTIFEIEQQYKQDCYKYEYYFCPPSLYLEEIWQFQMITDTCKDPEEIIYKGLANNYLSAIQQR